MRTRNGSSRRHLEAVLMALVATILAVPLGAAAASAASASTGGHRAGRSLTVLESFLSWTSGLDPATNPSAAADQTLEDAVFGQLFELGSKGQTVDDLAAGSRLGDGGRTLTIELRKHVRFSDGTPFDAAAVVWNLRRDLRTSCPCRPNWPGATVHARGRDTVVIHLARPDGAIVDQFQDSIANWMVSPTALRRMGATSFAEKPVGAGPFEVVSDTTNEKLVLRRNPRYWQKGRPHLGGLVFQVVNGDQMALEDLRSGAGDAYEAMSTPGLLKAFTGAGLKATLEPSTSPLFVAINASKAPFDRRKAREALYRATDAKDLDRVLNGDAVPPTESFTGPTGRFYEPKVPGYPSYDLTKAKKLVHSLGRLHFTLVMSPFLTQSLGAALQSMYEAAGMKVKLASSAKQGWGAALVTLGAFDPAGASGLGRYAEAPGVGALVREGEAAIGTAARTRIYRRLAAAFAKDLDGPFLYPPARWSVAAKGVRGPGLTTVLPDTGLGPPIRWEDVSLRR